MIPKRSNSETLDKSKLVLGEMERGLAISPVNRRQFELRRGELPPYRGRFIEVALMSDVDDASDERIISIAGLLGGKDEGCTFSQRCHGVDFQHEGVALTIHTEIDAGIVAAAAGAKCCNS